MSSQRLASEPTDTTTFGTNYWLGALERVRHSKEIAALQASVDQLTLINRALWELLAEQTDLGDRDLEDKLEALDIARTERAGARPDACAGRGRKAPPQRSNCLYCGAAFER